MCFVVVSILMASSDYTGQVRQYIGIIHNHSLQHFLAILCTDIKMRPRDVSHKAGKGLLLTPLKY